MLGRTKAEEPRLLQLTAIEEPNEIEEAFAQLRGQLLKAVESNRSSQHYDDKRCWLVNPRDKSKKKECEAFWFANEGFWIALETWNPNTYFVSYGTTDPDKCRGEDGKPALNFLFQGNIKRTGNGKGTAGAFGSGGRRQLFYVHTGQIHKAPRFADLYGGPRAQLAWKRGQNDLRFAVGNILDGGFISDLISFVTAVVQTITGGGAGASETFYRSTLRAGIVAELQTLAASGIKPDGTGVSSIRLRRLTDLASWLQDDGNLLDPAVDAFVKDKLEGQRKARWFAVIGAAITLVAGWLISAVNPHDVLKGIASAVSTLMALVH